MLLLFATQPEYGSDNARSDSVLHFIWTIISGAIVGVIAKWLHPGPNEPSGFILTAILGIVGAFVGTYVGQLIGWYGSNDAAGWTMSVIGAIIVLAVWSMIARRRGA